METLMLRRNKALVFAGGLWVFPGGSIDPQDYEIAGGDIHDASRVAAAREAQEECGLTPDPKDMVLLSHWITPVGEPRRFSTWIYAAPLEADDVVTIDGGEIHDSRWLLVAKAVADHEAGQLDMLPPTYITLRSLAEHECVADVVVAERDSPVPEVFPIFAKDGEQIMVMFRGDSGYEGEAGADAGPRHRATLVNGTWQYEYEGVDPDYPALVRVDAM